MIVANTVYHTGHVVQDIRQAITQWRALTGAGPFTIFEDFAFIDPTYRGRAESPKVSLAFGFSGDFCIELIQVIGEGSGIYGEVPGPLHHIGIGVPNLTEAVQRYSEAGVNCAFRASFPFGGGCAYLDTLGSLGFFTELVELNDTVNDLIEQIRLAHRNHQAGEAEFVLA